MVLKADDERTSVPAVIQNNYAFNQDSESESEIDDDVIDKDYEVPKVAQHFAEIDDVAVENDSSKDERDYLRVNKTDNTPLVQLTESEEVYLLTKDVKIFKAKYSYCPPGRAGHSGATQQRRY